jgi:hypothetical protein
MLYVDIPTRSEFATLSTARADACVSIYLKTTPVTQDVASSRIEFGNLMREAQPQLQDAGFDKRRLAALLESLSDLLDDDEFWRFQANSLAVFATPDTIRAYRLANDLTSMVQVSDRFHLKPLLRAVTFPHSAFILALSENAVRLVHSHRIEILGYAPYSLTATNIMRTVNTQGILCLGCNSEPTGSRLQKATQTRIQTKTTICIDICGYQHTRCGSHGSPESSGLRG